MERYNRDFNKLFPCIRPSLFNFCECLHGEATRWLTRHEDARNGIFIGGQKRRSVDWPEIPLGFEEGSPKKEESEIGKLPKPINLFYMKIEIGKLTRIHTFFGGECFTM